MEEEPIIFYFPLERKTLSLREIEKVLEEEALKRCLAVRIALPKEFLFRLDTAERLGQSFLS